MSDVVDGDEESEATERESEATEGKSNASEDEADVRLWLVERTYSEDEQNLIILTYATTDGRRYHRKERALTSFSDVRETTAATTEAAARLGTVEDETRRQQYAAEARRMAAAHDPDDVI